MNKRSRIASLSVLAALAMSLWTAAAFAQAPTEAPAPADAPAPVSVPNSIDDAMVVVTVGDIEGFIRGIGSVTREFMPMMNSAALKAQFGQIVQDPTLEGLPAGNGATVLIFPGGVVAILLEVSPAKIDSYAAALKTQGQQAEKLDDLLAIGADENGLATAKKFAATAKTQYLRGAGKPTALVTMNSEKVVPILEPKLKGLLGFIAMAQAMGAQAGGDPAAAAASAEMTQKLLEAELQGAMSVLKQTKTLATELAIDTGINLSFDLDATPGSNLGKLVSAASPAPQDLMKMTPNQGSVRAMTSYNVEAFHAFVKSEADQILSKIAFAPDQRKAIDTVLEAKMSEARNGVVTADAVIPGKSLMSGTVLYGITDSAKMMQELEKMPEIMKASSNLTGTPGQTVEASLTKNAQTYNDVSIHQLKFSLLLPAETPAEARQMLEFMGASNLQTDVAIVDKVAVLAMGGTPINPVIDAVKAKAMAGAVPMKAEGVFGPKAKSYIDIDMAKLADVGIQIADKLPGAAQGAAPAPDQAGPAQMLKTLGALLKDAQPITMAGFWGDGNKASFKINIPTSLVGKLAQGAMMAQAMSGAQAGPPPTEAPAPTTPTQDAPPPAQPNPY